MSWKEITVATKPEEIDEVCQALEALGVTGLVIEDQRDFEVFLAENRPYWDYVDEDLRLRFEGVSRVKFYAEDNSEGLAFIDRVRESLGRPLSVSDLQDEDWENGYKKHYKPIPVGEKLIIVPEWETLPEGESRVPLRLDPGLIFGTGSHATTQMCLEAVERFAGPGLRALDLGCGSGILSIAALLLGCDSAAGCDIDPKAPDVAGANAALNGFGPDRFTVLAGDVLSDAGLQKRLGGGYGLVLANIVADVIIPLAKLAGQFMAPDAVFVCSGIIAGREGETGAALKKAGLRIEAHHEKEDWHCFVCRLDSASQWC